MKSEIVNAVVDHAREAAPAECCGILIGREGVVVEARRARNIAESPRRFLIDPRDHIDARRDARQRGLEVVGFYHSHPHSPAVPSDTDRLEASYDGHLHVIVSLASEPPDVRVYLLEGEGFRLLSA
jgi:proteasome lid subunit RPN8/RPN11